MSRQKTNLSPPFWEEEDSAEENLLRDTPSERPIRQARNVSEPQDHKRTDLADTFNLFKSYLDIELESLKEELSTDETNGYTARFLGFSVYVSNTSTKDEGVLCFRDTTYTPATIPNPTNITCITHGRYVIYYNNRTHSPYPAGYSTDGAFNELCEVEVYGCLTPYYGEYCSLSCPKNCQEGHCNIEDGTCLGCVPGYTGPRCEKACTDNKYGLECSSTCGKCLNGVKCNHVNGSCPNGCDAGSFSDKCDKECLTGWYGLNCKDKCSINCGVPENCDKVTGKCDGGCKAGWSDDQCKIKCPTGKFGQGCTESCGNCVQNEACHHVNGSCLNGCNPGYEGTNCTQGCKWGSFGYNCNETCRIICAKNGTCSATTGTCELSYQKDRAFIVTQYPTPEDAVDFLRLLNDHESDTVICMNPLHEIDSSKSWMPRLASSKNVSPFVVKHESESDTEVKVTTVSIIRGEETPHSVVIVEPKGQLNSTGTPPDTSFLRSIVSYTRNLSTENPITIVSKDGASLCGVFCAVFNSIQQITMDDNIDVFTTVRQLQTSRPELCSTQLHFN
uniref:Endothelial cells scavenger receptor n=1 Tax=Magallana gigas TaxID=29159 RepID=K1QPX0_MAGGI